MTERMIHEFAEPDAVSLDILRMAMEKLKLSARAYSRILKVARTIAGSAGSEKVKSISRHARHGTHTLFLLYDHLVLGCTIAEPAAKGTGHVAVQIFFHGKERVSRQG